jgi:hypothetical protein
VDGFKKNEEELKKYVEEYKIKLRKSVREDIFLKCGYKCIPVHTKNKNSLCFNYNMQSVLTAEK